MCQTWPGLQQYGILLSQSRTLSEVIPHSVQQLLVLYTIKAAGDHYHVIFTVDAADWLLILNYFFSRVTADLAHPCHPVDTHTDVAQ